MSFQLRSLVSGVAVPGVVAQELEHDLGAAVHPNVQELFRRMRLVTQLLVNQGRQNHRTNFTIA